MISMRVDPRSALRGLTEAQERQLPFAVSLALNRVANDAQEAMRAGLKQRFKLRREAFNIRGIKIEKQDRANKSTWRVVIRVSPQVDYLNKFEAGGNKIPAGGRSYLWEPNAKVFRGRILPAGDPLRPKNLHLHKDPSGRVIGDQRTFLAHTGNPEIPAVVVQRQNSHRGFTAGSMKSLNLNSVAVGMGPQQKGMKSLKAKTQRDATVTLYKLRKRIPVKAQLQFLPTVQRTVHSRFQARMEEAMAQAMRSAR